MRFAPWLRAVSLVARGSWASSLGDLRARIDSPRGGMRCTSSASSECIGWAVRLTTGEQPTLRIRVAGSSFPVEPRLRPDVQSAFKDARGISQLCGFRSLITIPTGLQVVRLETRGNEGVWIGLAEVLVIRPPPLPRLVERYLMNHRYAKWARSEERWARAQAAEICEHIAIMVEKPAFLVVVDGRTVQTGLSRTLESIDAQYYPYFKRVLLGATSGVEETSLWGSLEADFLVLLEPGEQLDAAALYEFAAALNHSPKTDLIYGDVDTRGRSGQFFQPYLKPDWSPDLLEAFNYIGFCACLRLSLLPPLSMQMHRYDLTLRLTERSDRIQHVPKVLGHGPPRRQGATRADIEAGVRDRDALQDRLARTGRDGSVGLSAHCPGTFDVRIHLRANPVVSVIVDLSDVESDGDRDNFEPYLGGLEELRVRSTYSALEIVVVLSGKPSASAITRLSELGCELVTGSPPGSSSAQRKNDAARVANGEYLLFFGASCTARDTDWIQAMLAQFEKPHVGVVGATFVDINTRTVRAGIVHALGRPQFLTVYQGSAHDDPSRSGCIPRNYSAVSGLCMMCPRVLFISVGGFCGHESAPFYALDFCQRVRQEGKWVVCSSDVVISIDSSELIGGVHLISLLEAYQMRWPVQTTRDPFFNDKIMRFQSASRAPVVKLSQV